MFTKWILGISFSAIALAGFSQTPIIAPNFDYLAGMAKDTYLMGKASVIADYAQKEPPRNEPDPLFILNYYARQYGVDFALGETLMWHESRYCQELDNPKSTASGCYQFLDITWESLCQKELGVEDVYNYRDNIQCAMWLIGKGGLSHWRADPNIEWMLKNKGFIK